MSDDINRQIFREEAYELLTELETTLLELEGRPEDIDIVNRVFRALHTIKGSGSMFGFDDIAEFTHEVESMFDMVRNGELKVTRALLNQAFAVRDHIQRMLDEGGGDEIDAEEAKTILHRLRLIASGEAEEDAVLQDLQPEGVTAGNEEPSVESEQFSDPDDLVVGQKATNVSASLETPGEAAHATVLDESGTGTSEDVGRTCVTDSQTKQWRIRILPHSQASGENFHIEPLLDELAKLGPCEVRADDSAVPELGDILPGHIYVSWEVTLVSACTADDVKDVFFFSDAPLDIEVDEIISDVHMATDETIDDGWELLGDATEEAGATSPVREMTSSPADTVTERHVAAPPAKSTSVSQTAVSALPDASGKETDQPASGAPAAIPATKSTAKPIAKAAPKPSGKPESSVVKPSAPSDVVRQQDAMTSIRVAAEKLDSLVDLVGELVIVQAQISQLAQERDDTILKRLAEDLERLSDELRDSALGVRMLPIGTSFSKFRRLVRDLSGELGKEIELTTVGADTELDKTVIERLADPLVHLLRNSIDHGVELPDEREAAGKPRKATIRLSAEHAGGEVLIRIHDDGKGIDPDVIRAKALERGLISSEADVSRSDILNLIFEPGFSTAKQVTSVSGRGVGMDVVKRAIDSLRGRIEIGSVKGEGTDIAIRLPLTLAIIDGLQVRVGDEYYVIPLSVVEECVELRAEDEAESSRRILYLRGEIVPYVQLREWFEINAPRPEIEQVVIVGLEGRRVGIVVDKVIGEHQTVIKSLGRIYKNVDGISGATIKGDGSIALILDVPGLMKRVVAESA